MSLDQQRDILNFTFDLLTTFNNGIPPKGSVAPWWETSKEGTELLLEKGIEYGIEFQCPQRNYTNANYRSLEHGTRVRSSSRAVTEAYGRDPVPKHITFVIKTHGPRSIIRLKLKLG